MGQSPENAKVKADAFDKLGDKMNETYRSLAPSRFLVRPRQFSTIRLNDARVEWFIGPARDRGDRAASSPSEGDFDQLRDSAYKRALGRFSICFSTDKPFLDARASRCFNGDPARSDRGYLFFLDEAVMVRRGANDDEELRDLTFLIVPASTPMLNHRQPVGSPWAGTANEKDILDNIAFDPIIDRLSRDLDLKRRHLRGAVAEWCVYILASTEEFPPQERTKLIEVARKMTVTLMIPYLQIEGR